ncbi:MAG: DUF1499 domain-containing protein [Ilumatobacter sp.]|jgi:uncharacterized protein (DUF1499 family)|uniref:DUF1499 domain-containing protein n=1 Tax=Ilumatobacter sp. TaxID=1967498 RepID=UPI00391C75F1
MNALVITAVVTLALVVGAAIAIRRADDLIERWHADPMTAARPATPNSYRYAPLDADARADEESPVYSASVDDLARTFDTVARSDARVDVLAGAALDGHVTYIQRSALFSFPDYVSVRFIDRGDGTSTFAAFSRSRYGKSDLGVNKKRLQRWVGTVDQSLG